MHLSFSLCVNRIYATSETNLTNTSVTLVTQALTSVTLNPSSNN